MTQKIFCIGLSKTATTSLTHALRMLGYKANHFPLDSFYYNRKHDRLELVLNKVRKYDVISDLPAARFYKELDTLYPDARFILTLRDIDSWLSSCENHLWYGQFFKWQDKINKLHMDIYGSIDFERESFREAYTKHEHEVKEYFKGRDDLLVMNITKGDGWDKLCDFLGIEKPDTPFPRKDRLYTHIFKYIPLQKLRPKRN